MTGVSDFFWFHFALEFKKNVIREEDSIYLKLFFIMLYLGGLAFVYTPESFRENDPFGVSGSEYIIFWLAWWIVHHASWEMDQQETLTAPLNVGVWIKLELVVFKNAIF